MSHGTNRSQNTHQFLSNTGEEPARFIEPMLLLRTDALPTGGRWQYELKLDGYRAIAFKRNGAVHLRSRNDKDFSAALSRRR